MDLASQVLLFHEALEDLELDPLFWNEKNKLHPEITAVLQEVTQDVLDKLKDQGYELEPEGVILTGSLTSVNYDESSDVDFHILVDFTKFPDPKLMQSFLAYFAKNYNNRFDLRGRNLELYFQDAHEPHVSPGIYDVTRDKWLMPPTGEKIEKTAEMKQGADAHKKRVEGFAKDWEKLDKKDKKKVRDFLVMLNEYFQGIRKMRKEGIATGGLASVGNQVFKMLRRNGTLEMLTGLMTKVQDEIFEA